MFMNNNKIIQKSISGAKWTIILSIIALPMGYATNIILGKISPEALGIYGLLNIFIVSVTTFILFGGSNVIVKYLPEIEDDKKVSFLLSYIFLVFLIAIFAVGLFFLCPKILDLLFGQAFPLNILPYLIIFIPVIILYSIFNFILNGLMEIKTSVVIRQAVVFCNFIAFSILFFFYKDFFRENLWMIILGLPFVCYTVLGLLASSITIKKMKATSLSKCLTKVRDCEFSHVDNEGKVPLWISSWRFRIISKLRKFTLYLPKRFWSFALFVHISTILVFVYDKIDQLFILNYFSIHELGLYYAALKTVTLIRYTPMLLGSVLLPTFSNLLVLNEIHLVKKVYREIVRYNTMIIIPMVLFCIFFSRQIMGLFGEAYVHNHLVLVVLSMFYGFTPMAGVNYSLVIAKGKSGIALINSIIQIGLQVVLMLFLINRIGILGLAIGRGAGVVLAQIGLIIIVTKILDIDIKIPKSYKIGIITTVIASILYFTIPTQNIIILTILFFGCFTFFIFLADYSKKDIDFILKHLFSRNKGKVS